MKPRISISFGEPVAMCNRCNAAMCFVHCKYDNCKVTEIRTNNGVPYINTPIGQEPPLYCLDCELLTNIKLN
jgi:hypothetical protein